jgi:hypothetical protein
MMPSSESYNCEFFVRLKGKWKRGKAHKKSTAVFLRANFPDDARRILAWLDRPIGYISQKKLLSMSKFDL